MRRLARLAMLAANEWHLAPAHASASPRHQRSPGPIPISSAIQAKIYLDAGSEDLFHLDEGTEFLHRILYDARITHEYHYVYRADHIGASLRARQMEALEFLTSVLNPKPPDPAAESARKRYAPLKAKFGVD
jgi:hypothetical protein